MKAIAEIGINHNGDIDIVKKLIKISAIAGFDYVKFQKRSPGVSTPEHMKSVMKMTPDGKMTYLEYKKMIELGVVEYDIIKKTCRENDIGFFASVWDYQSAMFMKKYSNIVKIPSALINNIKLLKHCKGNYEYRIMSTGMSTERMIEDAVKALKPHVIMHTNSCYPSPRGELNLLYILHLKEKYPDIEIGYSGHEVNLQPTLSAVVLGVTWIERHVTLDRHMWGSDQLASVEPEGMFKLIKSIREIGETLKGCNDRHVYESENQKLKSLRKKDLLEIK